MKLTSLVEDLPQPKKQVKHVLQKDEAQGDSDAAFGSRWYTPKPAHKNTPYRQSKKTMPEAPGEGHEDHILTVGESKIAESLRMDDLVDGATHHLNTGDKEAIRTVITGLKQAADNVDALGQTFNRKKRKSVVSKIRGLAHKLSKVGS